MTRNLYVSLQPNPYAQGACDHHDCPTPPAYWAEPGDTDGQRSDVIMVALCPTHAESMIAVTLQLAGSDKPHPPTCERCGVEGEAGLCRHCQHDVRDMDADMADALSALEDAKYEAEREDTILREEEYAANVRGGTGWRNDPQW